MPKPIHIAVFIGATAPVLSAISRSFKERGIVVVALPTKSNFTTIEDGYISALLKKTAQEVCDKSKRVGDIRLSVWYYDFGAECSWVRMIREKFFPFSCFVRVPREYCNQPKHTANYIRDNAIQLERWLNEIYQEIMSRRNTSPFLLPLRNFESKILLPLCRDLIGMSPEDQLQDWLNLQRKRFRQNHSWKKLKSTKNSGPSCFHDRRGYAFQPTPPEIAHGEVHWGDNILCYLNGKLRFGATFMQGFHYDVQPANGGIKGVFFHCDGKREDLTSGNYAYVNTYPNDRIDPKK